MVFDAEGKILTDTGVQSLLKNDPEVHSAPQGETNYRTKIVLHPKAVLPGEPILESLDLGNVSITPRKIEWLRLGDFDSRPLEGNNEREPPDKSLARALQA